MKKIPCFIITGTALMLFACSTDETLYHDNVDVFNSPSEGLSPRNNDNAYEYIGRIYSEALHRYLKAGGASSEGFKQEINELISGPIRLPWKRTILSAGQSSKPDIVVIDPWQTLEAIVAGSDLTPAAQASLLDFIGTVLAVQYEGYQVLYNYITGYESLVTNHPGFTEQDKQVILTFSSLVRHAAYPNTTIQSMTTEIEDEDWDLSVGNAIDLILMTLKETEGEAASAMMLSLGNTLL